MACMRDLSTVRGHILEIQQQNMQVLLLNIHQSPAHDLLSRFDFLYSPTYLIYDEQGVEIFRSNELPSLEKITNLAS